MVSRETFDDVFDDDADEDVTHRKEWSKVESDLKKDGYRNGMDTGKEATLQMGFNDGYSQATGISHKLGHLRGRLSAHLSWRRLKDNSSQEDSERNLADIESLIQEISQFEKHLVSVVKQQPVPLVEDMDSTRIITGRDQSEISGDSCATVSKEAACDCRKTDCQSDSSEDQIPCSEHMEARSGPGEITTSSVSQRSAKSPFEEMFSSVYVTAKAKYETFECKTDSLLRIK